MPRPRNLPDVTELRKLLEQGLTHLQIAAAFGVTEQAVSNQVRLHGLQPMPPRYADTVPWVVAKDHRTQYALRMLRLYGKQKSGQVLKPGELAALERFQSRLDGSNTVIDYADDIGFYLTERREGIDLGMIREPRVPDPV